MSENRNHIHPVRNGIQGQDLDGQKFLKFGQFNEENLADGIVRIIFPNLIVEGQLKNGN